MVSSRGAQAPQAQEPVALPEDGGNEEAEWDEEEQDTSDSAEFFASDSDEDGDEQVMTAYELGQEFARLKGIWEQPRSR